MHRVIEKMRTLAGIAAVAAIAFAAHGYSAQAQDAAGETVVVTVDGKNITEADMKLAEGEIGAELAQLPADVKRRALAEYLIDNQLFANAAEAAKLGDTPEFQKHMAYLRERALREQYFEKTLKGSVSVDEAQKIYNARVAELKPEVEFAARHILVNDEAKAKELRAKLAAGGDFAQLAKENTLDTGSKEQGGLLGYFGMGQMVPEFEATVAKMQKGELSEPVKTQFGWHIIKLEDRRNKAAADLRSGERHDHELARRPQGAGSFDGAARQGEGRVRRRRHQEVGRGAPEEAGGSRGSRQESCGAGRCSRRGTCARRRTCTRSGRPATPPAPSPDRRIEAQLQRAAAPGGPSVPTCPLRLPPLTRPLAAMFSATHGGSAQ